MDLKTERTVHDLFYDASMIRFLGEGHILYKTGLFMENIRNVLRYIIRTICWDLKHDSYGPDWNSHKGRWPTSRCHWRDYLQEETDFRLQWQTLHHQGRAQIQPGDLFVVIEDKWRQYIWCTWKFDLYLFVAFWILIFICFFWSKVSFAIHFLEMQLLVTSC